MKILNNVRDGFLAGSIGLFGSKLANTSLSTQLLCDVGMSSLTALSMQQKGQSHLAVYVGMLLPTAIDLTLTHGFGLPDYISNPLNVALLIGLNIAAKTLENIEPVFQQQYNEVQSEAPSEISSRRNSATYHKAIVVESVSVDKKKKPIKRQIDELEDFTDDALERVEIGMMLPEYNKL